MRREQDAVLSVTCVYSLMRIMVSMRPIILAYNGYEGTTVCPAQKIAFFDAKTS